MSTSRPCRSQVPFILNGILFSTGLFLNLWAGYQLKSCGGPETFFEEHKYLADTKDHYPLTSLAKYSGMRYDAELGAPSVFKGPPRKELDEAWNELVDMPMIMVDEETLQSFDPTSKPSKGTNGHYYATVEVFHQLHCLDITRKFIWRTHYGHVDTFQDPPDMVWEHVDHCIDLLRQVLMCHSDIGPIFYTDVRDHQPVARVSTTHMCRNFSQVAEWVNQHDSEMGTFAEEIVNGARARKRDGAV